MIPFRWFLNGDAVVLAGANKSRLFATALSFLPYDEVEAVAINWSDSLRCLAFFDRNEDDKVYSGKLKVD